MDIRKHNERAAEVESGGESGGEGRLCERRKARGKRRLPHERMEDASEDQDVAKLDAALASASPRVISHMNKDHSETLVAWAVWYGKIEYSHISRASLVGISREGWTLEVSTCGGTSSNLTIPFQPCVQDAKQLRKVAVQMHNEVKYDLFHYANGEGWKERMWICQAL